MKSNVIILTSGLSGSSVLTGLVARAGYWTGDTTYRKEDYDTFENRELIELDERLIGLAGFQGDYASEFSQGAIRQVSKLFGAIDDGTFRAFIGKCERNGPWVWKDPRLWLTIRFWFNLLDPKACRFIILARPPYQLWISSLLRRQITSFGYLKNYEARIRESLYSFLEENGLLHLLVDYEELIRQPAPSIARLNDYLGTTLSVDDLAAVYHGPLRASTRHSLARQSEAMLIYARNYSERRHLSGANRYIAGSLEKR